MVTQILCNISRGIPKVGTQWALLESEDSFPPNMVVVLLSLLKQPP